MAESMKVGLVLSGGGAKGAYQVGVLKALRSWALELMQSQELASAL